MSTSQDEGFGAINDAYENNDDGTAGLVEQDILQQKLSTYLGILYSDGS